MKIKIPEKMKNFLFKRGTLLLIALLPAIQAITQEVTKEFRKEFVADENTVVDLNNRYGNVVVASWNNNKVDIYVKITVEHPDRSKAEELINLIDIRFEEMPGKVTAETIIYDKFNSSVWGKNKRFSINYTVKMPYNSGLVLTNKYGDTFIDELGGHADLNVKYGNLTVTELTRGDEKPINHINIGYGKALIKSAGWLDLYLRYATMVELPSARALLIDSKYSKIKIGNVSSMVVTSRYDNYSIDKINNLIMETGYTTLNVGTIEKKFVIEGNYGSINVDNVPKNFDSIDINTKYTGVRIGIDPAASYKLDGTSSYSSIKFPEEHLTIKKRIIENTSSEIEGIVGKEQNTSSTVKVRTSYGSVKLY
ncbi:MAG TPA: hypothetical protein DFI01_02645 [Bacteroidales bacterium]|nr:hypothetical protein [Bacteroidales bacterium]